MQYFSLFLIIIGLLCSSCNGSKKSATEVKPEEPATTTILPNKMEGPISLGIKRSQCYGKCPAFEFSIDQSGLMSYNGKAHVEKMGIWKGTLPEGQRQALWDFYAQEIKEDYKDLYKSGAMDVAISSLRIGRKDSVQTIVGDFAMPEPITALINYIDSLSNSPELKIYEAFVPRGIIPGEIIVDMAPGKTAQSVCDAYKPYGLTVKKRISPALSLYVLNFDENLINPGRMLVLLKANPKVQEAQFNKSVDQRD